MSAFPSSMNQTPRFGLVLSNRAPLLEGRRSAGAEAILEQARRADASGRFEFVRRER